MKDTVDTTETYVDHSKTTSTFNKAGAWKWGDVACKTADGQLLYARGELDVLPPV